MNNSMDLLLREGDPNCPVLNAIVSPGNVTMEIAYKNAIADIIIPNNSDLSPVYFLMYSPGSIK